MKKTAEELLAELVSIPSSYPDEAGLSHFLEKYLQEIGFEVSIVSIADGRNCLLAKKGNGEKSICFYGHIDTVPIVNASEWSVDPYKLTKHDDRYYGLGVSDMKSGIAAILTVAAEAEVYLKIVLAVDEENISAGSWEILKTNRQFFDDVELIISAEPCFQNPVYGVTTGRVGRIIYEVDFRGKSAHVSESDLGVDAIAKLSHFLSEFYARPFKFNSKYSWTQVRAVRSEAIGMSVPVAASAEVEFLQAAEDDPQDFVKYLESLHESVSVGEKPRQTPYLRGYSFDHFSDEEVIGKVILGVTNHAMEKIYRRSVGDDNVMASLGIPVITWGPKGGNEHGVDEYVEIPSLTNLIEMYRQYLGQR